MEGNPRTRLLPSPPPPEETADTATKDGDQTDDGATLSSHDIAAAATPHEGEEDDGLIKSAKDFPLPWGEHYLVARIEWRPNGTRGLQIAATTGEEVPQEAKDFVIEFLDGLSEGTPLIEVVQRARDIHPNRPERFFQMRRMWPWRSQCDTFWWLGTLWENQRTQQVGGASRLD